MFDRCRWVWLAVSLLSAAPAASECTMRKIAELPVTMDGLRPMVPATLNGTEVKFIADSGAFLSLISPSTAAQLRLKLERMPIGFRLKGIGGTAPSAKTRIENFGLIGFTIPDVEFLVGGSDNGRAGLLGLNVLGLADTEYDLAGGVIRLFRTPDCASNDLAYWAADKPASTIEIAQTDPRNRHIVGFVTVNGVRLRAVFDTGAPRSMLTLEAARSVGVTPQSPKARADGISSGLGPNVSRSWTAPFDSLVIGNEQIQNARLRFSEMPGFTYDLLLGADFFLSHRIFVSPSTGRLFLTYNGGAAFDQTGTIRWAAGIQPIAGAKLPANPLRDDRMPNDADSYARRGAALAARHDFAQALFNLGRAIELAPNDPKYLYARASAFRASRQTELARRDLDAAIALKPDYVEALVDRGVIYLSNANRAAGLADLDTAARFAPDGGNMHMALAELYVRADAFDAAIREYGRWLLTHGPQDNRFPQALNGRCWARNMLGRDLDQALNDCNAAVRAAPDAAGFRDSRGQVYLRMGDYSRAIADYDAALKMQPRIAWSLYGRGLAKQHKGRTLEGDADIAAALAIDPGVARQAQRYGFTADRLK